MAIRAFLFDYGGTLDGEGWHWFDRFVHLYREAGSTLPIEAIKEAFYRADERIAAEAAREGYRLRPLLERHVALQTEVLGEPARRIAGRLVDGFCDMTRSGWERARAALGRLRSGARLGVVSNFYGNLEVLLGEAELTPLLDVVVESVKVGVEKPDPRIYRIALERLGLPPAETMMVGDNFERDVRVARSVGMRTAWLRRGDAAPPEPGVADRVIGRLDELVVAPRFKAGIIAAGLGERFRRAGVTTPKPLVEVGGKTLLARAIDSAAEAGASEIALIVNAESPEVAEVVRKTSWPVPVRLTVRTTPSSMESFFALETDLADAPFLLLTVDAVLPPSLLPALVAVGLANGPAGTLAVTTFVDDEKPLRVTLDESRSVRALGPAAGESPWVTSGTYFFHPFVYSLVGEARRLGLGALREFLGLVLERGGRLWGFPVEKSIDVDRPSDVVVAERFLREGR